MRLNAYNGDRRLRVDQAAAWLLLNAIDNLRPTMLVDSGLRLARFACSSVAEDILARTDAPSPSRALCDLFWARLPWQPLARTLGAIHLLDLGCGSGGYARRFREWSSGAVARYTGVDIQPHQNWPAAAAGGFADFRVADARNLDEILEPTVNLIESQSTLEHVADDGEVFERMHAYAHASRRPLLQLHAIPSAACLRLYLWHGYRQYTPRTASELAARFADCSERRLIALGGKASNALHWRYITWPLMITRSGDRRDVNPPAYRRALADAVARDCARRDGSPAFYVLLVFTNPGGEALPDSDCWREER
jgi:SAM-dependent methyltransferase